MNNYRDKIRKLLALSESPVEAEATAALLKARELMAKYKIEQSDVQCKETDKLVSIALDDVSYHSQKDSWVHTALGVIEDYFPVVVSIKSIPGKKKRYPGFSGYESDVRIAIQVIRYIYDCVYSWAKKYCRDNHITRAIEKSNIRNNYGYGFCIGWNQALKKQKEDNPEWGLVLVAPDVSSLLKLKGWYMPNANGTKINVDGKVYMQGCTDGEKYGATKRISKKAVEKSQQPHS